MYADDTAAPALRAPSLDGRVHANTKRYVRLAVFTTAGGIIHDPATALSHAVRARLSMADKQRIPGPCRRIDPVTGEVIETLDPFTRRPIP